MTPPWGGVIVLLLLERGVLFGVLIDGLALGLVLLRALSLFLLRGLGSKAVVIVLIGPGHGGEHPFLVLVITAAVRRAVASGSQIYWVCPLIEESDKADLTAATLRENALKQDLPECRTALVHGAMTPEEKQTVMAAFSAGEIDILVATTVIEVGVDVPNASVMIIEHAERFGLSQLHQLRGRVGRGSKKSFCLLLYSPALSEIGKERLSVIRSSTDGFEIAREDLRLRGPGEFMGARQSGAPMLRFADVESDAELLDAARNAASLWLAADPETALKHAKRWFAGAGDFLRA